MSADIVERVRRSARYRGVDPALVARLAAEELPRARNTEDAVKRVKRRLHQAVGAFRSPSSKVGGWPVDDPVALREACRAAMAGHSSTRERLPHLDVFYSRLWAHTGLPRHLLDLGCGMNPLALPWMHIGDAAYVAVDADAGTLATVEGFLAAVAQPHATQARDLVAEPWNEAGDVALLLKLVATLDRQDRDAAARLLRTLDARHAIVSFTTRTLSGRARGMERTYRDRIERLAADAGRVREMAEASVPNELVFVLTLEPLDG